LAETIERTNRTVSLGKIYHHGSDDNAFWDVLDACLQSDLATRNLAEAPEDAKTIKQLEKMLLEIVGK
tara:strand:- start:64474 stop:64677 length:204 start_codon:yes stop_codon:yes gene_type:complete